MIEYDTNHGAFEKEAFATVRSLLTPRRWGWGELLAWSQATISRLQEEFRESDAGPIGACRDPRLVAAARTLDMASTEASQLSAAERGQIALLAATAYGMGGNAPSAGAVASRYSGELGPAAAVAISTAAPQCIPSILGVQTSGSPARAYLEELESYLNHGSEKDREVVREKLRECIVANDEGGLSDALLRASLLTLEITLRLAVVGTLKTWEALLPNNYARGLVRSGVRTFMPSQYASITNAGMLDVQGNLILSMPTSAGKSLLGELLLAKSLATEGGWACLVTPYVALAKQTADGLRRRMPASVRVAALSGSLERADFDTAHDSGIVVATPERLDLMLRNQEDAIRRLRVVVVDEAHNVGDGPRGMLLEGLLTRLRLTSASEGSPIKIALLSAVLDDPSTLMSWLDVQDDGMIQESWKPTASRVATWTEDGNLSYVQGRDLVVPKGASASSVIGTKRVIWPHRGFRPPRHYGDRLAQQKLANENIAYLADTLVNELGSPVLIACATRQGSRKVAKAVAKRLDPVEPIGPIVGGLVEVIRRDYTYLFGLAQLLEHGVGYHNAGLPIRIRRGIEEAVAGGELVALASTSTLAEGIDLPFRSTIVADWMVWSDQGEVPMDAMRFRNIAGRCGRAGVLTEGDTILFENPVTRMSAATRHSIVQKLANGGDPTSVDSAMVSTQGREAANRIAHVMSSQFLAAIPENPDEDDLVGYFVGHSLGAASGGKDKAERWAKGFRASVLEGGDSALATAASPLSLTPLGIAARRTGLSPSSARKLCDFLSAWDGPFEDVDGTSAALLVHTSDFPEQVDEKLRKLGSGTKARFAVGPTEIETVAAGWRSGRRLLEVFLERPYVLRSRKRISATAWSSGVEASDDWDSEFEKFQDFVARVLGDYLPWVLRSCGRLSPVVRQNLLVPWSDWAYQFKYGVDSAWACAALNAGAPGGRELLAPVGRVIGKYLPLDVDPLGSTALSKLPNEERSQLRSVVEIEALDAGNRVEVVQALWEWLEAPATE